MFKTILAHFVELAQKLLIIYFMNVFILTSFGKISNFFGLLFLVSMLSFLMDKSDKESDLLNYFLTLQNAYLDES